MIKHQTQPCAYSCTSACLAMMLGIPVNEVREEFHDPWFDGSTDPAKYLSDRKVPYIINANPFDNIIKWDRLNLLTVPSLNLEGQLHHLIATSYDQKVVVFDPNKGQDGKKYYVWGKPQSDDEVNLSSWIVDLYCIKEKE